MINKKVSTIAGSLIIIAILVAIGFIFFSGKEKEVQDQNNVVLNNPKLENEEAVVGNETNDTETIDKLMEDLEIYTDTLYGFEFKYPEKYSIETQSSPSGKEYFIKNASDTIAHIKLRKWNGYIIQEGTPGTEAEKRAHNRWEYFADNFNNIKSGNCDDTTITHVPGSTMSDTPRTCIIDKQANYIKVETESSIIYYTKTLEIYWGSASQNFDPMKKIVSTFKISEKDNNQKEIIMEDVSFCGKSYTVEKIVLNDIDIIKRIATIAQNNKFKICENINSNSNSFGENLPIKFNKQNTTDSDYKDGVYFLNITLQFKIDLNTNSIFILGGYASEPTLIGELK